MINFQLGTIVMAKMPTYDHFPAVILKHITNTHCVVSFPGDLFTIAKINKENVITFSESNIHKILCLPYLENSTFESFERAVEISYDLAKMDKLERLNYLLQAHEHDLGKI